ncbi:MAG: phosphoribosylglycinamide formyltransferase [Planctomycetes bacterium]|nr:phosphoribosylglycinamide formyltransferase [Planctomycetota bacterium]
MTLPLRLAVLLSGTGRTLQNFIDLIEKGELPARIRVVVSSRLNAVGIERARRHGLPVEIVPRKDYPSVEAFSKAVADILDRAEVDLVLMAGFTSLFHIPPRYLGRVINIHPALLPKFGGKGMYGRRVHEAVLAAGTRESGCTVHFADNRYDHGPTVLQRKVPVLPGDTPDALAERVFREECIAYPEAVRLFADGKVRPPASWASSEAT